MCDRAVFMRQRFCDEIKRNNFSTTKITTLPATTTAADVRPASGGAWLQLAPAKSPKAIATEAAPVEQSSFLSNCSSNNSRASSFSSSRSEAGL